jgi:flagellar hook-associated protein 3 FlgL
MRIASAQYQTTMARALGDNQAHAALLTQQMANGQRIQLPSDDPVGTVRLSRLNREQAMLTQYRDNIAAVGMRLAKNETYLSSMVTDMQQARDLLLAAADGSNTSADLGAKVSSLTALRDSLLYTANVKDQQGNYVFSGTLTDRAPIQTDAGAAAGARYSYGGNHGQQKVVVGNGITQTANVDIDGMQTLLNQLDSAIATLSADGVQANDPAVQAVISAGIDGTDVALDAVATKIAIFGGAQNILSTLDGNLGNVSLSNQSALINIGQLDYGLAATELNGYTTALQATYAAYAKIGKLSLFDVL